MNEELYNKIDLNLLELSDLCHDENEKIYYSNIIKRKDDDYDNIGYKTDKLRLVDIEKTAVNTYLYFEFMSEKFYNFYRKTEEILINNLEIKSKNFFGGEVSKIKLKEILKSLIIPSTSYKGMQMMKICVETIFLEERDIKLNIGSEYVCNLEFDKLVFFDSVIMIRYLMKDINEYSKNDEFNEQLSALEKYFVKG